MAREFKLLHVSFVVVLCLAARVIASAEESTDAPDEITPVTDPGTVTEEPAPTTDTVTEEPAQTTTTVTEGPAQTTTTVTEGPAQTTTTVTEGPAQTTTTVTEGPAPTTTTVTEGPAQTTTTATEGPAQTTTTATEGPAQTTTTVTEGPAQTTDPGNTAATTQSVPTTTKTPDPCETSPCGRGSTCEARANQTYVCLCLPGDSYDEVREVCVNAKVFPGQLVLSEITYDTTMSDNTSPEFEVTSKKITNELSNIFKETNGYSESIVLQLKPLQSREATSRSGSGVRASVKIIFDVKSDINATYLNRMIKDAANCEDCVLNGTSFTETDLCDEKPCEELSTACSSKDGLLKCTCRKGYILTSFSDRMCTACLSGEYTEDYLECIACPFGHSGLDCRESWQLALVIVGSVLGGLLLITLILLPVVATTCSKKSSKSDKKDEVEKPYVSQNLAKLPVVNGNSQAHTNGSAAANPRVPRIPRATTTSGWDSSSNMEMNLSSSRQNLISADKNSHLYDDLDDTNPYTRTPSNYHARPQNNPYSQNRPQNNPYAQNRPQNNPYAQSRGQTNPYYE